MIVLGIDPGTKLHGVAVIDLDRSGRFTVIAYGHVDSGKVEAAIREYDALVAVEIPVGLHGGVGLAQAIAMSRELLATRGNADGFDGLARGLGRRSVKMPLREWRYALTSQQAVDDALVKRALQLRAIALPRTNDHARDAMGVAWAVGMKEAQERTK